VLDDAAVFDGALSADQVRGHAEVGTGRPVTVAGQETVTAAASDDGSVARVEFYVDGDRFAEDTSAPYAGTLETTGAEPVYDGTHQVTTKAYDEHGQVTSSSTTEIAVANTAGTRYVAELTSTPAPQAVTYDPNAAVQDEHGMQVTVRNASTQPWSATDVVLRPRWIPPDPGAAAVEGREVPLGAALAPGASRTVTVGVEAPPLPAGVDKAKYKLQVDAYEKSTGKFFADKGNRPVENPVIVNKELLTGLGLEKYYHYDGEQLGAGMTHLLFVANGNSLVRWTPFSSTGRGLSTVLDLTYNSLEKKSESPVGNNFSIAISGLSRLGNPIDIHPNKADEIAGRANKFVEITDGDGTTHRFEGRQAADGSTYWEEPEGVHLYLRSLGGADPARRWAFTRPDRVTFFYDADGYPTGVEDANGNRLTYVLEDTPPGQDPGGPKKRVARVTDAGGRSYDIVYYGKADAKKPQIRGKVRRITDHTGNALDFEYYEDGNLLRLIQRGGTNADGSFLPDRSFVFTYTTSNGEGPALTAAERANPDPKTPNQSTRLFSVRDPRGHVTTFAYLGTGEGQDRWKLASRTDRAGHTTAFAYDTVNRVTTVTAPLSRVTRFGYDVEGKVTSIVNPKQERTAIAWTAERHVAKVTAPTGREQRFEYDANGYLTKEWDELDRLTEIIYDHLPVDGNDVPGKWKPGRGVGHISQVKSRKTPRGKLWSFGHDARGNLTSVTDPENSVTRHDVNADGTLARTTDANGNVTRFPSYDLNGLATEMVREMDDAKDVTGPADRVTRFQHDADGLMLWVQDPLHRNDTGADPREYRTYFDYDSFQRMGRQSAPKSTRHARGKLIWTGARFDENDNLVAQVGAHYGEEWSPQLGTVAEHAYDAMDRQVESERPHEPGAAAALRFKTQTRYDAGGRLVQVTSPRGVATPGDDRDFAVLYDHDPLDRVIRLRRYGDPGDGSQQTRITHFCFDLAGDLRSITTPRAQLPEVQCAADGAPAGTPYTNRIEYTPAHEVSAQVDANGKRRESRYDFDGNLISSKDEHGTEETRDYNGRDQVIKVTRPVRGGDAPHAAVTRIEYDAVGNPKRVFSPRAHDKANGEYVTTYDYNAADELVRKILPRDGDTAQAYEHSAYDANGNLEKSTLPVTQETLAAAERDKPDAVRTMEYFDPGWVLSSRDENPKITYDYRAEGWQFERIPSDRDGDERRDRRSWIEYYPDGQPKAEYDRAGRPTEFRYDANNNLTYALDKGVEDGKQRPLETTATYDGFDEVATTVLEQEGEDDRRSKFLYDANGNTRERWDDRQVDASGSTTKEWRHHRFTYDPADRVELHEDFGRKDEASDDRRITTSYFDTGWKQRRVIARQVEGSMRDSQTTDWTYFLNGQLDTLETKARPKDSETWQTKESHDLEYIRDDVYFNGHRVEDRFQRDTPKTSGSCKESPCTQTFQYDARDRLTQENNGAGTTRNYTLDPAGNVTVDRGGPAGEVRAEYRGGQMVWQESAGHRSWQHYDDWGNLDCVASSQDRSVCEGAQGSDRDESVEQDYHYDANDVLLSFDEFPSGKSVDYVNDAFDRPVEERERQDSEDPKSKLYSYIGLTNQLADEEEFKREEPGGDPSKTRSYTYGPDGERIAMTYENKEGSGGEKDFGYGFDPQGSVSLLLDDAGKAQASYGYSAYGERDDGLTQEQDPDTGAVVDQTKDTVNPYRYSDKRWSPVSEQLDMGARRFAPSLHSFIQDDRYEQAFDDMELATDPLTQNRYSLAGGNPVSFVEVDGHFFDPVGAIEDAGEAIGDAGEFAGEVGEGFAGNIADTAVGAAQTATWANRSFNPGSAITDPKGFADQWKANYEGGKAIAENPEAAAKAVADSFTEGYRRGSTGNKIGHGVGDALGVAGIVGAATKGAKAAGAAGRAGSALSNAATRTLAANQRTARIAEGRIASSYPGAQSQVTLQAASGSRRIDVLTPRGHAIESKVGRTSLTSDVKRQIQRDRELLRDPASPVRSLEWRFATSPRTGRIGPTAPLAARLRRGGIRITYDP
jgi:RHS repeat-associated protein